MKENKLFYGWIIVAASAIVLAIMGPASVAVANIFQTPIVETFGITKSQFAISNSIVLGMGIFFSPTAAQLLAGKHFKKVFVIAAIIYALAYAGFGLTTNIIQYYILGVFVGLGYLFTTVVPTGILIANWFDKQRGLAMSLALAGLGIGGVIFSQLLTALIASVGWRNAYFIYGAIMLLVVVPIGLFVYKQHPKDMGLVALGAEENKDTKLTNTTTTSHVTLTFKETVNKPFFILLLLGAVFVGIGNNGGLGQFPPVLNELHGPAMAATVISLYSAVGIVGKLILGRLNDTLGTVKSIMYAATLLALAYVVMLFAGNLVFAFAMAVFFGLGNAIGTVAPPLITSSIYNAFDYPKAYGYIQSGVGLGMTTGSLIAASIADITGSYYTSWVVLAVISISVAICWVAASKNAERYSN